MVFILCWPITHGHGACPGVGLTHWAMLHWRKHIPPSQQLSVANTILVRGRPFSVLGFCLFETVQVLCVLSWCLWVCMCTSPVVSGHSCFFTIFQPFCHMDPWALRRADEDIPLRTECSKVSHSASCRYSQLLQEVLLSRAEQRTDLSPSQLSLLPYFQEFQRLNLGPSDCVANTLTHWAISLALFFLLFNAIWIHNAFALNHTMLKHLLLQFLLYSFYYNDNLTLDLNCVRAGKMIPPNGVSTRVVVLVSFWGAGDGISGAHAR